LLSSLQGITFLPSTPQRSVFTTTEAGFHHELDKTNLSTRKYFNTTEILVLFKFKTNGLKHYRMDKNTGAVAFFAFGATVPVTR
jgi:hypothetical protein